MTRRVWREVVPVDDEPHELALSGPIVHVGSRRIDEVEVWFEHKAGHVPVLHDVRVFGTGHAVPDGARHLGTAIEPSGALVWHLYSLRGEGS